MVRIGPNTHVTIKYTVHFGEEANQGETPNVYRANLLIGYDRIIPAVEEKLLGAKQGDTLEIVIPKEQSLGAAHFVCAKISVEDVRPATAEDIAARTAKSCGSGG